MNPSTVLKLALLPLLCVLAAGCKKKPVGVTPIPDMQSPLLEPEPTGGFFGQGDPGLLLDSSLSGDPFAAMGAEGEFALPDLGVLANADEDRETLRNYTVFFGYDSSSIEAREAAKVEAVADYMMGDPQSIVKIEGHCDERGTDEYNRALGERRALALRELLVGMGVSPDRVTTESWGEDRLLVEGTDDSAHAQNRRGEFVLMLPQGQGL